VVAEVVVSVSVEVGVVWAEASTVATASSESSKRFFMSV
jgi:hypothetical protein